MSITENYLRIREKVPDEVTILAAAKERSPEEVAEIIEAGVSHIGENYVQEAENIGKALGHAAKAVQWHMIGHLQTNKINKALRIFDVIQTVDSLAKAEAIDQRIERAAGGAMPVYIEVNIGSEISKAGVDPDFDTIKDLAERISALANLRLQGIMTLGPIFGDPEKNRPYFRQTKEIFDRIRDMNLPQVEMKTLSMGMTNSYRVAIEEGSNMVRIGTALFGERA